MHLISLIWIIASVCIANVAFAGRDNNPDIENNNLDMTRNWLASLPHFGMSSSYSPPSTPPPSEYEYDYDRDSITQKDVQSFPINIEDTDVEATLDDAPADQDANLSENESSVEQQATNSYLNRLRSYYNNKIDTFLTTLHEKMLFQAQQRLELTLSFIKLDIPAQVDETFQQYFGFSLKGRIPPPHPQSPSYPLYASLAVRNKSLELYKSLCSRISWEVLTTYEMITPKLVNATITGLKQQLHAQVSNSTLLNEAGSMRKELQSYGSPFRHFFARTQRSQELWDIAEERHVSASEDMLSRHTTFDHGSSRSLLRGDNNAMSSSSSKSSVRFAGYPAAERGSGLLGFARNYWRRTTRRISDYLDSILEGVITKGVEHAGEKMQFERNKGLSKLSRNLRRIIIDAIEEKAPELLSNRNANSEHFSHVYAPVKDVRGRFVVTSHGTTNEVPDMQSLTTLWINQLVQDTLTFAKVDLNKELCNMRSIATSTARTELSGWFPSFFKIFLGH